MMTYGISHLTSQNKNYSFTFTSSPFFLEKKISLLVLYHLYVEVQYSPEAKLKTVYIYLYFFYLNLNARLVKMGALDVPKVVHGRQGCCLITCMWLHAGVVHLLINMLCLVIIGIRLEQEFGFGKCSHHTHCLWINYSILHPSFAETN